MSDERAALRREVRRLLQDRADPRALIDRDESLGMDRDLWEVLTGQLGIASLFVGPGQGGAGASVADVAVVFEELGRALAPVPAFSTIGLVTSVLRSIQGEVVDEVLRSIAENGTVVALALSDLRDPWSRHPELPSFEATEAGGLVSGAVMLVLDGAIADLFLVPAIGPEGQIVVLLVPADGRGVQRSDLESLDLGRGASRVTFARSPGRVVTSACTAEASLGAGLDLALVFLAAEQVGIAERCLDAAIDYAKTRVQFNRPIGSFQAIKHLLTDLLLDLELARAATTYAVDAADIFLASPEDATRRALRIAASAAASLCKPAAVRVARETLHIFGGIGFTWEHDAHLAFRRAKATEPLLGDPGWHQQRLTQSLVG